MRNIVLIFGGESAEREVSIITAFQLEKMCDRAKYNLIPVLVDENKKMFWCKNGVNIKECTKPQPFSKSYKLIQFGLGGMWLCGKKKLKKVCDVDLALIACHGGVGENGEFVAKLNFDGIKTSVGGPEALEIAMDKWLTKCVMKNCGVDVVFGRCIFENDWNDNRQNVLKQIEEVGYPVIVKPARQGSSVGIGIAKSEKEILNLVELAFEFDNKIVVEKAIENFREYNISVLKSESECLVSGIEEAVKTGDFLSFEDKYLSGTKGCDLKKLLPKTKKISGLDAFCGQKLCKMQHFGMDNMGRQMAENLPKKVENKIVEFAKKATTELELYGVVRIDFLVDEFDNVFLNEINSVPGSLAYYFWPKINFFDKLVEVGLCSTIVKSGVIAKFL